MVHQYQKAYKNGFPSPSDEDCIYWYSFLADHMAKANLKKVSAHFVNTKVKPTLKMPVAIAEITILR